MFDIRVAIVTYTLICLMIGSMIGFTVAVVIGITKKRSDF